MHVHLHNWGGALDFADTKALLTERDADWNVSEFPKSTLTELKKQCKDSPEQESPLTSISAEARPYFI